jgi:hypothetical protein
MLSVPVGTLDDFSELSPLGKLAQSADAYHFREHIPGEDAIACSIWGWNLLLHSTCLPLWFGRRTR